MITQAKIKFHQLQAVLKEPNNVDQTTDAISIAADNRIFAAQKQSVLLGSKKPSRFLCKAVSKPPFWVWSGKASVIAGVGGLIFSGVGFVVSLL